MTVPASKIKSKSWAKGPPVQADFYTDGELIVKIQLSFASQFSCMIHGDHLEMPIYEWMENYLQGRNGKTLPLDLTPCTPFTKKGLMAVKSLNIGEVASYGEIAAQIGCPKGARAIGNVCNRNPFPLVIPCHRIIHGNGTIGGFALSLKIKRALLNFEAGVS